MATQTHLHDTSSNMRTMWMIVGLMVAAILAYAAYSYYQSDTMVSSGTSAYNTDSTTVTGNSDTAADATTDPIDNTNNTNTTNQ